MFCHQRLLSVPCRSILAVLAALAMAWPAAAGEVETPSFACHVGLYRLDDGRVVDIGLSDGGLRWRDLDGATGKLVRDADGWRSTRGWTGEVERLTIDPGVCGGDRIVFAGQAGRRERLVVTETEFMSRGERLRGRLVLPEGTGPVPIVVLLQGAEMASARDFDPLQRLLPAQGVGAFVYDKRGTGSSGGAYTQDFELLADDAVAAHREMVRLAGGRRGRDGFQGPSQGGWIAPMAASRVDVDFVIVSFGLAVSVFEEDQEAIAFQMGLKGHGPEAIAGAQAIGRAAAVIFANGFTGGFEAFEALRERYRLEPWYSDVRGNFTHVLLAMSGEELREGAARYAWGTPVMYDPMAVLRTLDTPQLWVLGGQDLDAPSGETLSRLADLAASGAPISIALYPGAEHGMTEFVVDAAGERQSTRYATG